MGEVLFELEQILRSKQGQFTSQEANILMQCKSNAMKDFTIGGSVGLSLAWLATRGMKMRSIHRINISAGAAAFCGIWKFGRSLDSCVEHILAMDGTRMQKELANMQSRIVNKNQGDHWTMQLITKHFYLEKVYDDEVVDQPKLRWRYRSFFDDQNIYSQNTSDNNSDSETSNTDAVDRKDADETKQVIAKDPAIDPTKDPFDFMFGVPHGSEEIHHHTSISSTSPRRRLHGHKKSHRNHRMRHREDSEDVQRTQQVNS